MKELVEFEIDGVCGGVALCNNVSSCLSLALNSVQVVVAVYSAVANAAANSQPGNPANTNQMGDSF